jgi:hypothetical protein
MSTFLRPRARPPDPLTSLPTPPNPIPCAADHQCPSTPCLTTLPSAPMRPPRPFLLKSASIIRHPVADAVHRSPTHNRMSLPRHAQPSERC